MAKYRFKTEEEFKAEGRWEKSGFPESWNISGEMNNFIGQDIPEKYNKYCDAGKSFSGPGGWRFKVKDCVLKEPSPSSIPEKWAVRVAGPSTQKRYEQLLSWRNSDWISSGYIHSDGIHTQDLRTGYSRISYAEFLAHVYSKAAKQPELIAGKWYKITSGKVDIGGGNWWMKFKEIDETYRVTSDEHICGTTHYFESGNFSPIGDYTFTPIDVSEIQILLPDGHPEKVDNSAKIEDILINEAKKRYPIGTEVSNANMGIGCTFTITGTNFYKDEVGDICISSNSTKNSGNYTVYLKNKNKWAEVVFNSEPAEYLECIDDDKISYGIIGRVYKFDKYSGPHWGVSCNIQCDTYKPGLTLYFYPYQLKPSTKEAYDAQVTTDKERPTHVKCIQSLDNAIAGKIYPVIDAFHCLCENNRTYYWSTADFEPCDAPENTASVQEKKEPKYPKEKFESQEPDRGALLGRYVELLDPHMLKCSSKTIQKVITDDSSVSYFVLEDYGACMRNAFKNARLKLLPESFKPKEMAEAAVVKDDVGSMSSTKSTTSMDRNVFIQANNRQEADAIFSKLQSLGEPVFPTKLNFVKNLWNKIQYVNCYQGWVCYDKSYGNRPLNIKDFLGHDVTTPSWSDEPCRVGTEIPQTTVKKEKPLIEDVHSISVNLSTKKKSNKLKF